MKTVDEYIDQCDTLSLRELVRKILADAFEAVTQAGARGWETGAKHVREVEVTRLKHDLQAERIMRSGLEREHKRLEKLAQESLDWKARYERSLVELQARDKNLVAYGKELDTLRATIKDKDDYIASQEKVGEDRTEAYYHCQKQLDTATAKVARLMKAENALRQEHDRALGSLRTKEQERGEAHAKMLEAKDRADSMALKLLEYEQHLGVASAEKTAALLTEKQKHVDALVQRVIELEQAITGQARKVASNPALGAPFGQDPYQQFAEWGGKGRVTDEPRWFLLWCSEHVEPLSFPHNPHRRFACGLNGSVVGRIVGKATTIAQVEAWMNEGKLP